VVRPVHAPIVDREVPRATLATLEAGRLVLVRRCTGCHWPPDTRRRPPGDWPRQLEKMGPKAKLDARQLALLADYLKVVSQPDFKPARQAPDGGWTAE